MFLFEKYHYVPPCPRCGSKRTGRYVYTTSTSAAQKRKIIALALKKGELCRVRHGFDDCSSPNLFCEECEAEWFGMPDEYSCTSARIAKEIKERDISADEIKLASTQNTIWERAKKKVKATKENRERKRAIKEKAKIAKRKQKNQRK